MRLKVSLAKMSSRPPMHRPREQLGAVVTDLLQLDETERCDAAREAGPDRKVGDRFSRRGAPCCGCDGSHAGLLSRRSVVVEGLPGEVAEDVLERRLGPERRLQLGGRAHGADRPEVHQRDAVAEDLGLLHVVRREQDGHAGQLAELLDSPPDAVAGDRVEPDRRLVEHEQGGAVDQGLCQLEPADHAARIGAGQPVGRLAEPHHLERVGDSLLALAAGHVEEARKPGDVLPPGEGGLDRELLRHVAEQAPHRHRRAADVVAEHLDHPLLQRQQGVEQPDRRRFARAVWPG